jgi:hypothetical protein
MEPSDFDRLLRDKVSQQHSLHEQEMEAAKPFVWSTVYNDIGQKKSLTWYHLAAAVLLLLITFSALVFNIQKSHTSELADLSKKIGALENGLITQSRSLESKNAELVSLKEELQSVEARFEHANQPLPLAPVERIVYRTDTLVVREVEYITVVQKPEESESFAIAKAEEPETTVAHLDQSVTDDIIFPSSSLKENQAGSNKIKFNPFSSRTN